MPRTLLVVGAGPMGLIAATAALARGLDVTVLEKERVGHAQSRWGTTRLFSPFGWNVPEEVRRLLPRDPGDDALLTGPEMTEVVLGPLAEGPLAGRVRTGRRVVAIGRSGMSRGELAGHPVRGERPFHVLAETATGEETYEADFVLDCSGVTGQPTNVGRGGVPALGERALAKSLLRDLTSVEEACARLAGERVLLLGAGHSAVHALFALVEAQARVTWAVRTARRRPCEEIPDDPLPERARIAFEANALAEAPPPLLEVLRDASVVAIAEEEGTFEVTFTGGRRERFGAVAALTGYRPDLSFLSELALELSPATEGAARLMRALSGVTHCDSPATCSVDLGSGEPGFHLGGIKSYGRRRSFLLRTGWLHLKTILEEPGA